MVNLEKSEFAKAQMTYLGYVVGQGHVLPREVKIQAIKDFPLPTHAIFGYEWLLPEICSKLQCHCNPPDQSSTEKM